MQKNFRLNANLLIYPSSIEGVRQIIAEVSALTPPLVIHQPDMLWALTVLPEIFSQTEINDWSAPIKEIKAKIEEEILHD